MDIETFYEQNEARRESAEFEFGNEWTDKKDNAIHESEGMSQHEFFHFPIVGPAPVRARQKRPANLDFTFLFFVSVKP